MLTFVASRSGTPAVPSKFDAAPTSTQHQERPHRLLLFSLEQNTLLILLLLVTLKQKLLLILLLLTTLKQKLLLILQLLVTLKQKLLLILQLLVALKQKKLLILILRLILQVGEVMDGRYEVFATHGKGVFSTVLRARDLKTEGGVGEVAIKIIRANETMYKAAQTEKVGLASLTINLQSWSAMMFTAIGMWFTGVVDGMACSHATEMLDECTVLSLKA